MIVVQFRTCVTASAARQKGKVTVTAVQPEREVIATSVHPGRKVRVIASEQKGLRPPSGEWLKIGRTGLCYFPTIEIIVDQIPGTNPRPNCEGGAHREGEAHLEEEVHREGGVLDQTAAQIQIGHIGNLVASDHMTVRLSFLKEEPRDHELSSIHVLRKDQEHW